MLSHWQAGAKFTTTLGIAAESAAALPHICATGGLGILYS
jgi:hypothetical protein